MQKMTLYCIWRKFIAPSHEATSRENGKLNHRAEKTKMGSEIRSYKMESHWSVAKHRKAE